MAEKVPRAGGFTRLVSRLIRVHSWFTTTTRQVPGPGSILSFKTDLFARPWLGEGVSATEFETGGFEQRHDVVHPAPPEGRIRIGLHPLRAPADRLHHQLSRRFQHPSDFPDELIHVKDVVQ